MNEAAAAKRGKTEGMARLVLILFAITVCTALLLGLVDYITRDTIDHNVEIKTREAMSAALVADSYRQIDYMGGDALVTAVHEAYQGDTLCGYVVEVAPSGFGGTISIVVGVDLEGAVTGVSIVTMSETSGLGANAKQTGFRAQYIGRSGELAVSKDGGDIDALTGATITSRAVTRGVNSALGVVAAILG